jgi:hypothetical protein
LSSIFFRYYAVGDILPVLNTFYLLFPENSKEISLFQPIAVLYYVTFFFSI